LNVLLFPGFLAWKDGRGSKVGGYAMNDFEKASRFIELAKTNQENLWKRRGIEWKINFGLWTALAIMIGAIYKEGIGDVLSKYTLGIVLVLGVVFIAYLWHSIGTVISDEKDVDWHIFYKEQAEEALDLKHKPPRQQPDSTWWFCHYIWRGGRECNAKTYRQWFMRLFRNKLHGIASPIAITTVLLLVLGLVASGIVAPKSDGKARLSDGASQEGQAAGHPVVRAGGPSSIGQASTGMAAQSSSNSGANSAAGSGTAAP
jgi:hypothetical protein